MLTSVERVLILKGADLLNDVGPRHLLMLAEVTQEVEIWKGDTIYEEDDLADGLYMVVEGRVRLTTGEKTTSEVGPGESFGTWALVDDSERGHRVECIEDGLALKLPRDEFYDVAAGNLALLQVVVRALAKRLRNLVTERPEEARIEGEGVEKPEALDEAKTNPLVLGASAPPTAEVAPALTPGESLKAAALGQTELESDVAMPPEPGIVSGEIATPEPIVPVEPVKPKQT
jgi:signal-transduction protein with cAMP-binding, CBS, and nucleotidyltransferase domain